LSRLVINMIYSDKEKALHAFWSSFGWAARDENTVPDDAMSRYGGKYITYAVSTASLDEPVPISGDLWCKDTSWEEITAKAKEISHRLGIGGITIPYVGGYLWIVRGVPFSQRMAEEDDTVRRIYINLMAEYLSAD